MAVQLTDLERQYVRAVCAQNNALCFRKIIDGDGKECIEFILPYNKTILSPRTPVGRNFKNLKLNECYSVDELENPFQ